MSATIVHQPWLLVGQRVPPGISLNLSFMTPGVLDPRITFTRASTGTYFDSTGTLQTATTNTPRWDYNPTTHALNGLLIEEQRTNVAFPSVLANAVWTTTAGALTPNVSSAPDGNNTAALFAEDTTSSSHSAQAVSTFAYVNANGYVFSIYAKQATARGLQIYTGSAPFGTPYANFDLAAGTVGTTSGATATIQPVGNSWYRCVFAVSATASAATTTFVVGLTGNNNSAGRAPVYTGTGASIYLWGAQTEAGAFPTSYIPTTAASVTRSADVCTMPTAAWFSSAVSSLAADFMMPQSPNPSATSRDVCSLSDGTSSNRMILRGLVASANTALFSSVASGTVGASTSLGVVTAGAVSKIAAAWNGVTPAGVLNGGAAVTYSGGQPVGINILGIGNQAPPAGAPLNGWVRRVRYWPRALSASELQSVTR